MRAPTSDAARAEAASGSGYVVALCPACDIERCDAEVTADGLQHLDSCPNCGSTAAPTPVEYGIQVARFNPGTIRTPGVMLPGCAGGTWLELDRIGQLELPPAVARAFFAQVTGARPL